MSDPRDDDRRSERDRGSVMVVAALAMVALLLFAALAIDVGFVWSSRTQSQSVSDAAAVSAAETMIVDDPATGPVAKKFDQTLATTEAKNYAAANSTVANGSVKVRDSDITFGKWNLDTRKLEAGNPADPNTMTGVRVNVVMDGTVNQTSPGLLSRLFQASDGSRPWIKGFTVKNTSVAYLGFEGDFSPGEFNLPVAIDGSKLSTTGDCGEGFCTKPQTCGASPPLERAQTDTAPLMCGEFSATGEQNMCWTAFDGESSSINGPKLQDIVDKGNAGNVKSGDPVYLDNGDKTSTVDYIRDVFYGCGKIDPKDRKGVNRYGTTDATGKPVPDSWVVKLPVVEDQSSAHCAGGSTFKIKGGVCFEIREVIAPAPGKSCDAPSTGTSRWIKGRPLCPNSTDPNIQTLYKTYCHKDGEEKNPGGCGYGERATRVVIVE
jgi:Flp pilus assembly protein TadG